MTLTASRTILAARQPDRFEDPMFVYCENEDTRLMLRVETWIDMGGPKQITVTVEPGDLLNEESA